MLSEGVKCRTAKDGVYLWDLCLTDVEGIAFISAWSGTTFSVDEDDKGIILVSVDAGNELVVLVMRAFWCTGKFARFANCLLFDMVNL